MFGAYFQFVCRLENPVEKKLPSPSPPPLLNALGKCIPRPIVVFDMTLSRRFGVDWCPRGRLTSRAVTVLCFKHVFFVFAPDIAYVACPQEICLEYSFAAATPPKQDALPSVWLCAPKGVWHGRLKHAQRCAQNHRRTGSTLLV